MLHQRFFQYLNWIPIPVFFYILSTDHAQKAQLPLLFRDASFGVTALSPFSQAIGALTAA
jgi:hypothetical protein